MDDVYLVNDIARCINTWAYLNYTSLILKPEEGEEEQEECEVYFAELPLKTLMEICGNHGMGKDAFRSFIEDHNYEICDECCDIDRICEDCEFFYNAGDSYFQYVFHEKPFAVGDRFIFRPDGFSDYEDYEGLEGVVVRALTDKDIDLYEIGPAFEAKLSNGELVMAYPDEMERMVTHVEPAEN